MQGFGDASYEAGWAQTGVLTKYRGMVVMWTSSKQPHAPRSTAESEWTAMAHNSQYLEGAACLLYSMRLAIGVPVLYCDNRAAAHLTAGSSERRPQALVSKHMGAKSLIELGILLVEFEATAEMQADVLTKFMSAGILWRQRQLVGCVPLHSSH